MSECFCGCGVRVGISPRRWFTNRAGGQIARDVAMLRGALERDEATAADPEVPRLIHDGEAYVALLRGIVHRERDRRELDKAALKKWWRRMQLRRERFAKLGLAYEGLLAHRNAELVLTGIRARGRLLRVEDTGMTVNNDPYVRCVVEVRPPDGGEPFVLEARHLVSRLAVPRPGAEVDVYYDPGDRSRWTFKEDDKLLHDAGG
jgi:hypothetical protein